MDSILDGQLSQNILVAVDDLVVLEDLRSTEDVRLHLDWHLLDAEVPVLDRLLVKEDVAHLLDLFHLLLGSDPRLSKSVSHSCTFSH